MLKVQNLEASIDGKKILKGIDLQVGPGEIHAVMGPNGSGKSTLAYVLAGHPAYKVGSSKSQIPKSKQISNSKIQMSLNGKNLVNKTPDQRARLGLFLAFQYPVSVEGVTIEQLLRAVVRKSEIRNPKSQTNSKNKIKNPKQINALEFRKRLEREAKQLGVKKELLQRSLNDGFSGGEKKRLEILQLAMLKPRLAILDETDSGLDVDALKIVAHGVWRVLEDNPRMGVVLITHYQRILNYLRPDFVHVMIGGKIVASGDEKLAQQIEKQGYKT